MTVALRHIPQPVAAETLWTRWYAWRPVFPIDDRGPFWLEVIWRRRHPATRRYEYRSFRTEEAKRDEMTARFF